MSRRRFPRAVGALPRRRRVARRAHMAKTAPYLGRHAALLLANPRRLVRRTDHRRHRRLGGDVGPLTDSRRADLPRQPWPTATRLPPCAEGRAPGRGAHRGAIAGFDHRTLPTPPAPCLLLASIVTDPRSRRHFAQRGGLGVDGVMPDRHAAGNRHPGAGRFGGLDVVPLVRVATGAAPSTA